MYLLVLEVSPSEKKVIRKEGKERKQSTFISKNEYFELRKHSQTCGYKSYLKVEFTRCRKLLIVWLIIRR